MPLRVAVLVPEVLPRWLKNSDIHQNRTLLALGAWTGGRLEMLPMAATNEAAWAAIAPLAAARVAFRLGERGVPLAHDAFVAMNATAWITRDIDADVILGHGLFPVYAPWVRRRPPLLWGPGYDPVDAPARRARAAGARFRRRIARAGAVFLANDAGAEALREDLALPAARVFVLPIFEPHLPRADAATLPQRAEGPLRVLFVGREARRKNLPGVLAAVRQLRARGQVIALTVVSDFRDGAVDIGGDATVIAELAQPEVFAAMQRHDVLCMPSLEESYGMVFIEAAAAGAAVIAPDHPVQRAMLGAGASYVDPRDAGAIAAALAGLSDAAARERQRAAALDRYRERYAPEVVASAFERALDAACHGARIG